MSAEDDTVAALSAWAHTLPAPRAFIEPDVAGTAVLYIGSGATTADLTAVLMTQSPVLVVESWGPGRYPDEVAILLVPPAVALPGVVAI